MSNKTIYGRESILLNKKNELNKKYNLIEKYRKLILELHQEAKVSGTEAARILRMLEAKQSIVYKQLQSIGCNPLPF